MFCFVCLVFVRFLVCKTVWSDLYKKQLKCQNLNIYSTLFSRKRYSFKISGIKIDSQCRIYTHLLSRPICSVESILIILHSVLQLHDLPFVRQRPEQHIIDLIDLLTILVLPSVVLKMYVCSYNCFTLCRTRRSNVLCIYCISVYGSTIFYAAACAECVATMFCNCNNGSTFCSVAAIMVLPSVLQLL